MLLHENHSDDWNVHNCALTRFISVTLVERKADFVRVFPFPFFLLISYKWKMQNFQFIQLTLHVDNSNDVAESIFFHLRIRSIYLLFIFSSSFSILSFVQNKYGIGWFIWLRFSTRFCSKCAVVGSCIERESNKDFFRSFNFGHGSWVIYPFNIFLTWD